MATPKTVIDIEDLPSVARTALATAIHQRWSPLHKKSGGHHVWVIIAGAVLAAYALFAGFGNPQTAKQEPGELILYAGGFGTIAAGILMYRGRKALRALLRCDPGIYVLGSRMLDMRTRKITVFALLDDKPHVVDRYVNGGYQGTTINWHGFTFSFRSSDAASQALGGVGEALREISEAAQAEDYTKLLAIDPMVLGVAMAESEKEEAFKRGDRAAAKTQPGEWKVPAIVLSAAAAVSVGAWFVRNLLSVEAAYDAIHSTYEVDAWVESGGDPERGRMRKMEIELTQVLPYSADNAEVLRTVLAKYPEAPDRLKKPVQDALKARYQAARKHALELSASKELTWFINQVYDRLEAGGAVTTMQIKVARTDNTELQKLDDVIAANKKLAKTIVPVAKYFGTADDTSRTERLKNAIQTGMAEFFPSDVMKFGEAKDAPEIEIFYVIRPKLSADGVPSLYSQVDARDRPIPGAMSYPGIEFELGATLKVPGGPPAQQVAFSATPSPSISVHSRSPRIPTSLDDPTDALDNSAVYSAMAESAFGDLQGKLVVALGGKAEPPPAREGLGLGDSDECKALQTTMLAFTECQEITEADRTRVMDAVTTLSTGKLAPEELCRKMNAILEKSIASAGCQ